MATENPFEGFNDDEPAKKGGRERKWIDPSGTDFLTAYDPGEFYLRTTDQHHHFAKYTTNGPTYLGAAVAEIVRDEENPYTTPADFIRDAIVHHVYFRSTQKDYGPEHQSVLRKMAIEQAQAVEQERSAQSDRIHEGFRVMFKRATDDGDFEGLGRALALARNALDDLGGKKRRMLADDISENQGIYDRYQLKGS